MGGGSITNRLPPSVPRAIDVRESANLASGTLIDLERDAVKHIDQFTEETGNAGQANLDMSHS